MIKQPFRNNRVRYNLPLLKGYVKSMFYIRTKFLFLRTENEIKNSQEKRKLFLINLAQSVHLRSHLLKTECKTTQMLSRVNFGY